MHKWGTQPWWLVWLAAVSLLWLAFALMLTSAGRKSITVDEQSHLFRGVAYVRANATQFLWGHPLLASSLNALPLLTESDLRLPIETPAWAEGKWAVAGDAFLWQLNENPHRLIFLGRLPTMWLTLLLGALLFRWGQQMMGPIVGLLSMTLILLDPNILAHGRLVTSDISLTLFMTLAIYGYWRWATHDRSAQGKVGFIWCGLGLGAAAATKFSAVALLPMLGIPAFIMAVRQRRVRPLWALFGAGLVGGFVVWAVYRFSLRPYPASAFWADVVWQLDYFSRPHGAYLLAEYSATGWWYYFPVALLVKTPLPTLLLLSWSIIYVVLNRITRKTERPSENFERRLPGAALLFLLLPSLIYFALSLMTPLNIG